MKDLGNVHTKKLTRGFENFLLSCNNLIMHGAELTGMGRGRLLLGTECPPSSLYGSFCRRIPSAPVNRLIYC